MTNPSQGGETPRTDAHARRYSPRNEIVSADFARELERELARATQENEELRGEAARLRALLGEAQAYLAARNLGEPAQNLLTRLNAELREGRTQ